MNKKKFIYLIVSLTLLCVVLAACAAIDGIRFEKEPRTVYVQGQDIDMTDTVLLALTGDKSEAVDLSQVQISGYDKNLLGEQTVTFTYQEKTTTLKITVIPRIAVEGAVTSYFVGDTFNKTEGRLKVANDQGKTTTINMSDEGVTVLDFDSSAAAKNKTVTIQYGGYTGTFAVDIYEIDSVELTGIPRKLNYLSHEQELDLIGAYFTVNAKNNEHQSLVTLTQDMISGYDPSVVTPENMKDAVAQTITVTYLGNTFQFEIGIRYSAVTLMQLRAEELKDVTDPKTVTDIQGQNALDAMVEFFKLPKSQADLIGQENTDRVALVATVYGYARFLEASESLSGTIKLYSQSIEDDLQTEEDESATEGAFNIVAESYETVVRDLARLEDSNEPFVILCEVLARIEEKFPEMTVDGKNIDEYLDLIYSINTLDLIVDVLSMMVELHETFQVIPEEWTREELEDYRGAIKSAVATISASEFNPFTAHISYIGFFEVVSSWRKNNDYMEIIYSYYMEHEPELLVSALWQKVPLPGALQELYTYIRYGGARALDMRVGTDTTLFMYYYREARRLKEEIETRNDPFEMEIYQAFSFAYLVDTTFFYGNAGDINGIAYLYHIGSLMYSHQYDELMEQYLDILSLRFTTGEAIDFRDEEVQKRCRELLASYLKLTPGEKHAFLGALYCDYRYQVFDEPMLGHVKYESGGFAVYSWFANFILNSYHEMLTEEGFEVLADLLVASEQHAIRYRSDAAYQAFLNTMSTMDERYQTLPAADQELLADFYVLYRDIYQECCEPSHKTVSAENQARLDELKAVIDSYYVVQRYLQGEVPQEQKPAIYALAMAHYERILAIMEEINESGEENAVYLLNYAQVTFETDMVGEDDTTCTYDYIVSCIGDNHFDTLLAMDISAENDEGKVTQYFAYPFYSQTGYREFLNKAYDIMVAEFRKQSALISYDEVLELMAMYRELTEREQFANMILCSHFFYFNAIHSCMGLQIQDAEVLDVVFTLLIVENNYAHYLVGQGEASRTLFMDSMELLKTMYENLSDKSLFADFMSAYEYYAQKYEALQQEQA